MGTRAPPAHTGAALQILYQRCCLAQMNGFDLITIIFYQKHGELRNATGPLLFPAPHSSYRRVLKMIWMSTGHRSSFRVVVNGGELSRGLSRRNVGRRDKGLRDASSSCSVSPEAPPPDQWLLLIVFWTDCRLRSGLLITVARMIITVCNCRGKQTAPPPRSSSGPSNYTITGQWSHQHQLHWGQISDTQ